MDKLALIVVCRLVVSHEPMLSVWQLDATCDFYEDVCRLEIGGTVDFVDLVRFVELHHLDGSHLLGKFFDAHCDGWWDGKMGLGV